MKRRETIAIDLDDVLAAHVEAFVAFSNKNYSTHLRVEDYSDHWADIWNVEHAEIERRAAEFHIPESIAALAVNEEAKSALRYLSNNYDIYVVTARSYSLVKTTREWLDRHFSGIIKDIHFVPIWEPDNQITKAEICRQIGAGYLIDDLARHCSIAAKGGIKAILFGDYAWNRSDKIDTGVTRCKDWKEVLKFFIKVQ